MIVVFKELENDYYHESLTVGKHYDVLDTSENDRYGRMYSIKTDDGFEEWYDETEVILLTELRSNKLRDILNHGS